MTYGQLLRQLAQLSEEQLTRDVTITTSDMSVYAVDKIVIWAGNEYQEDIAEVDIQIVIRE